MGSLSINMLPSLSLGSVCERLEKKVLGLFVSVCAVVENRVPPTLRVTTGAMIEGLEGKLRGSGRACC